MNSLIKSIVGSFVAVITLVPYHCLAQDVMLQKRLKLIGEKFERLPLAKRTQYVKLKQQATAASKKKEHFTCMVAIDGALAIFKEDMDLIWLKGICRAQIHDIDGAIAQYKEVLKINPTHVPALMNMVEINFFAGRYGQVDDYITFMSLMMNNRGNTSLPLLDFKHLLTRLAQDKRQPVVLAARLRRMHELHSYMEDHPYYYYANALKSFDEGKRQEGLIWISKADLIFNRPALIDTWNKALVDTGYVTHYEIMRSDQKNENLFEN